MFDRENPKEFKDWWDNVFATTLEMDDVEEYITDAWSSVPMPLKLATEYAADETDKKVIDLLAKKNKIIRKEMKKAKAHMVKVTKNTQRD